MPKQAQQNYKNSPRSIREHAKKSTKTKKEGIKHTKNQIKETQNKNPQNKNPQNKHSKTTKIQYPRFLNLNPRKLTFRFSFATCQARQNKNGIVHLVCSFGFVLSSRLFLARIYRWPRQSAQATNMWWQPAHPRYTWEVQTSTQGFDSVWSPGVRVYK